MRFQSLPEWLNWQEKLHFTEVDPGLDRIGQVWQKLTANAELPFKVITIAGTNGKGSSVAMLDSILRAAGYRTGTYTSPHLLSYNERIVVNGSPCTDDQICAAFERIDQARQQVSLTYFEFATLAAILIFCQQQLDVVVLEVGMGGRLDAVNLFDADIALITPIGLDHTTWLGNDREVIAKEKAGIIRANKPVVCSEAVPPLNVLNYAKALDAPVYQADKDFQVSSNDQNWHWSNKQLAWHDLPLPALAGAYQLQNAAAVLQVLFLLKQQGVSVEQTDIKAGLTTVKLAGRFQQLLGPVERIFDVTHNQQGAENLVQLLTETACKGRTLAVLAMLNDKDVSTVAAILANSIDSWYIAGLAGSRGMTVTDLTAQLKDVIATKQIIKNTSVIAAYQQAMSDAKQGDRILIFGSFHTVEAVMLTIADELNKDVQ